MLGGQQLGFGIIAIIPLLLMDKLDWVNKRTEKG